MMHLVLGCFQMLPIGALDGGCVMRLLLERFCLPDRAEKLEMWISAGVLLPLFWLGFRLFLSEQRNFTLLLCCVFLLLTILRERSEKI